MISEMPLPTPFSVICSPSHMMKQVPAVRVKIVMILKPKPGSSTSACPGVFCDSSQVAMNQPWMTARNTVP